MKGGHRHMTTKQQKRAQNALRQSTPSEVRGKVRRLRKRCLPSDLMEMARQLHREAEYLALVGEYVDLIAHGCDAETAARESRKAGCRVSKALGFTFTDRRIPRI